jgi:hypothetical protein
MAKIIITIADVKNEKGDPSVAISYDFDTPDTATTPMSENSSGAVIAAYYIGKFITDHLTPSTDATQESCDKESCCENEECENSKPSVDDDDAFAGEVLAPRACDVNNPEECTSCQ